MYHPCYSTCKKCTGEGTLTNHKCTECILNYSFKSDLGNNNSCYSDCSHYYYFDENSNYHCTESDSCIQEYSKLIEDKRKCIKNCSLDEEYKYELSNTCYKQCPETAHISSFNEYYCENTLICAAPQYYNYNMTECINEIPDGFFNNSTESRTIDKCHENCKKCEGKPTSSSQSCTECNNDVQYFYLGNCFSNCPNGYFIENDIKKCNCPSDIICSFCSDEGMQNNLCASCNADLGYYPIKDDPNNNNSNINCYNSETIPQNYYLNSDTHQFEPCPSKCKTCSEESLNNDNELCLTCNVDENYFPKSNETNTFVNCYNNLEEYFYLDNQMYHPCYSTCKKCTGEGTLTNHKCTECILNHSFKSDLGNNNSCYFNCDNYYYFDGNNKYYCTESNNCIEEYSKLIVDKRKCIKNCSLDEVYKYELNNSCYKECPGASHISSSNEYYCEIALKCSAPSYYNYNMTECINEIPDGYFINSSEFRTIDKCHEKCKKCDSKPTSNNQSCTICNDDTEYLYSGNCFSNCPNGYFIENDIKKCNCPSDIICSFCSDEGMQNNLCASCNADLGYYPIKDDPNNNNSNINCYNSETIPQNYYLNSDTHQFEPCPSKCKTCSEESLNNDNELCLTCNVDENYFPKSNETNTFVNCYNNLEEYFYLDNQMYHPCYSTCKKCTGEGTLTNHKCSECILNHSFKSDLGNNNSCYLDCNHYYYFDENNNYYCTESNSCIEEYSKLIINKGKCIKNCSLDEEYKYELSNTCYKQCPGTSRISSFNEYYCENTLICAAPKYYNYNMTECINEIPDGFFVNNTELRTIDKCHSNCKTCNKSATSDNNNCMRCKNESFYFCNGNCLSECFHYYYYNNEKQLFCTEDNNCPENYPLLIEEEKNRCIDDCKKSNYTYKYENNCYKECPNNTSVSTNDPYVCEKNPVIEKVKLLISDYITKNHTCEDNIEPTEDKKSHTKTSIFTQMDCSGTQTDVVTLNFDCYDQIKKENNVSENEELIIAKVDLTDKKTETLSMYAFYDPKTGEKLDSSSCKKITVEEDLNKNEKFNNLKSKDELVELLEQGIDVFNCKNDEFFSNICYSYKSPNGKDIPLKARLKKYCPNITLCDTGCESVGVDLVQMRVKCECKFIDLVDINKIGDNYITRTISDVIDIISELNIAVVKCFKDIFNRDKFKRCTGGFIILALFLGQIICYIKFALDGLYSIRKYFHVLTQSFLSYIGSNNPSNNFLGNLNVPPIKKRKKRNGAEIDLEKKNSTSKLNKNSQIYNSNSKNAFIEPFSLVKQKLNVKKIHKSMSSKRIKNKNKKMAIKYNFNEKNVSNGSKELINMKEYLSLSFDENDFDDVIDKDKRSFYQYFCIIFKENQIFISTFFKKEILRPLPLKCLVLLITIELYFTITALFYNEDYLTDLFYSTEEEKFFSFVSRRFNQFMYSMAVSGIITYLVGFFFVEENKIKKIFIRNRQSDLKMKYEISIVMKDIERKFSSLIIFSIVLTIICFIYISCFNIVYPCIKYEWIKASIFVLIVMQFLSFLLSFIQCVFRYLSIKCNSEKLFKLSQVLSL